MRAVSNGVLSAVIIILLLLYRGGRVAADGRDELQPTTRRDAAAGAADDYYGGDGTDTRALYESVRDLLLWKITDWLQKDGRNLRAVAAYLGLRRVTRNLLNVAMTELMHAERAGGIRIARLADMFFYACDVANVRRYGHGDVAAVTARFAGFAETFRAAPRVPPADRVGDLVDLQQALLDAVRAADRRSKIKFTVSVPLMKWLPLTDRRSADETVRKLQHRFLGEHAADMETAETDGRAVTAYHTAVLAKIVPDVFGFVYDHVALLCDLSLLPPPADPGRGTERLHTAAGRISAFVVMYNETLVDRYLAMTIGGAGTAERAQQFALLRTELIELAQLLNPDVAWTSGAGARYADKRDEYAASAAQQTVTRVLHRVLGLFGTESADQWLTNRTIRSERTAADERTPPSYDRLLQRCEDNGTEAYNFLTVLFEHLIDPVPSREAVADYAFDGEYKKPT